MAQLFVDSFSVYATADIPTRWAGGFAGGGPTIVNTPLPPNAQVGAQVLSMPNASNFYHLLSNNYGNLARMIIGTRFMRNNGGNGTGGVMQMLSGVGLTPVVSVWADDTGTYITGNEVGSSTLIGTGPIIPRAEWHHYELDATFSTTGTAVVNLYLDGNPTPFISCTGVSTGAATASQYSLGAVGAYFNSPYSGNGTCAGFHADHYAFSGTGSAPFNAALAPQSLGAPKIAFAVPNGVGTVSAWTPNGAATIWQSIDQIPQDGDTTYASSSTIGQQYMCTFGALPAMQTLISVQLSTYARTDDAGPRAYQSGFWKGGTFGFSGTNQFLAGTYNYIEDEYMTNPVTGLAWTPADITGLQFGAELTV
jgi:hypothetical protein